MRHIFVNKNQFMKLKIRLLKSYIWSTLTYGCEDLTLTHEIEKNIKAEVMCFLKRILWISYADRVTNVEELKCEGVYVGHHRKTVSISRAYHPKKEYVALQGRPEEKRAIRRRCASYFNRIK